MSGAAVRGRDRVSISVTMPPRSVTGNSHLVRPMAPMVRPRAIQSRDGPGRCSRCGASRRSSVAGCPPDRTRRRRTPGRRLSTAATRSTIAAGRAPLQRRSSRRSRSARALGDDPDRPSGSFATQPSARGACASRRANQRKPTPWTRPRTVRRGARPPVPTSGAPSRSAATPAAGRRGPARGLDVHLEQLARRGRAGRRPRAAAPGGSVRGRAEVLEQRDVADRRPRPAGRARGRGRGPATCR